MITYTCDICKKEIEDIAYHGEFSIKTKVFTFVKHQKEDQIRAQVFLFCPGCADKVKDYVRDLQKK